MSVHGELHERVWAGIELYDPDAWAYHSESFRGLQIRDPAGYDDFLDRQVSRAEPGDGEDAEERRNAFHEMFMEHGPIDDWRPPESFWQRTRQNLAPSWEREHGQPEFILDGEPPSGLFVDVSKLNPEATHVFVPQTDHLPLALRVLIAARWGALSQAAREQLEAGGTRIIDVVIPEDALHLVLRACWGGSWHISPSLRTAIAEAVGTDPHGQSFVAHANLFDQDGPFSLSMKGLSTYTWGRPIRENWPILVVVGGSADDLALSVVADRSIGRALWVPPDVHDDDGLRALGRALSMPTLRQDTERRVHVTSCSVGSSELESFVERLKERMASRA